MPKPVRWGEPELQQLGAAVKQNSLYYWNNQQTKLLMERYRAIYGHKYVQPCSSGSASLHIAVAAAGIAPGDEVITSGITDIGTVIGVLFQQAVPVFADLEPQTGCLDPADVERKITPKTKAIIAVHLAGQPVQAGGAEGDCRQAQADPHRGLRAGVGRALPRQTDQQRGPDRMLLDAGHQAHRLRRRRGGGVGRRDVRPAADQVRRQGYQPSQSQGLEHGPGRELPHERAAGGLCGRATDAAGRHRRAALEAGQPAHRRVGGHPRHHDASGAPGRPVRVLVLYGALRAGEDALRPRRHSSRRWPPRERPSARATSRCPSMACRCSRITPSSPDTGRSRNAA